MNSSCNYPKYYNICSNCATNASLVNGICKCNNGYSGLGYIHCNDNNQEEQGICYRSFSFFIL